MPRPVRLDEVSARRQPELGNAGDWAPPCAARQLGALADWLGDSQPVPDRFGRLRLFRCKQMFLLVVPGIVNERPQDPPGLEASHGA